MPSLQAGTPSAKTNERFSTELRLFHRAVPPPLSFPCLPRRAEASPHDTCERRLDHQMLTLPDAASMKTQTYSANAIFFIILNLAPALRAGTPAADPAVTVTTEASADRKATKKPEVDVSYQELA